MERILKAMNQDVPESKRILELNPEHPIMEVLARMYGEDANNPRLDDYSELLYDQGLLTEGSPVTDPLAVRQAGQRVDGGSGEDASRVIRGGRSPHPVEGAAPLQGGTI